MRTQFDMKDLESAGLVKFDFLGLKTLTVIQEAVNNVARTSGAEIDVLKLPITDPKTYELYASGETTAVFQMESPGMQRSEEHTSELQSLMRISYAVFCCKKKKK